MHDISAAACAKWLQDNFFIPEGKFVGKPLKLTEHEMQWLVDIYDSPTRQFILSMPRKNGKSMFSALLILLHLAGPRYKPNSQLYSAARSRDQAAVVFELAAKMVRMSQTMCENIGIRDTAKELYCSALGTSFKALSADSTTAFGRSPVFVVHDELGQVRGPRDRLHDALETASAAHDDPLSVVISTQAPTYADLLSVLIDEGLSEGSDPETKVVLHKAPKDADPFSEETLRACNPHFDDFMNIKEVKKNARKAERLPSFEAAYRNLHLNQRVEAHSPFVAQSIWCDNGKPPQSLEGRKVWAGLDLSSVNDLTGLIAVAEDEKKWDVESTFWLPEEGLAERARQDRVPYDIWAKDGYLDTTPGRSIEYEFVAHELRALFDRCDVQSVAFDRWGMRHLIPWLEKAGFTEDEMERFVPFGQGFKDMTPALRVLEGILLNENLRHGMHPVLTMCAANAVAQSDPAGNRKLSKNKSSGRIDGMVALTMAIGVATQQAEAQKDPEYQMLFV